MLKIGPLVMGSISGEHIHETLAQAMRSFKSGGAVVRVVNRDAKRYEVQVDGRTVSVIKQVASGRFGVKLRRSLKHQKQF